MSSYFALFLSKSKKAVKAQCLDASKRFVLKIARSRMATEVDEDEIKSIWDVAYKLKVLCTTIETLLKRLGLVIKLDI